MGGGNTCPNCSGAIVEMGKFPEREKEVEARYCADLIEELMQHKVGVWIEEAMNNGIEQAYKATHKEGYIITALIHKLQDIGPQYLSLLERKGNDG
jgi:hypothetical protein